MIKMHTAYIIHMLIKSLSMKVPRYLNSFTMSTTFDLINLSVSKSVLVCFPSFIFVLCLYIGSFINTSRYKLWFQDQSDVYYILEGSTGWLIEQPLFHFKEFTIIFSFYLRQCGHHSRRHEGHCHVIFRRHETIAQHLAGGTKSCSLPDFNFPFPIEWPRPDNSRLNRPLPL